jgi:two-component system phosphate regulon sensor histidine kinase PhoR
MQIDRNIRSLVTMIDDFLDLARLDASRHGIAREEVDLLSVLDRVVENLMPLIESKSQQWSLRSPRIPLRVIGDLRRLHQVLSNLIGNAIKFTSNGGEVWATIDLTEHDVQLSIHDTGPGIDPDLTHQLFGRYQRADENVAGSGLGLMIVKEVVETLGGSVGVESTLGAGARFWIRLPRAVSTAAP